MFRKTSLILVLSLACLLWTASSAAAVYAVTNSNYSLAGAEYQLYTDSACTTKAATSDGVNALLVTGSDGNANVLKMAPGTYYAKEIKPGRGFRLDTDESGQPRVYKVTISESNTESSPASFTSSEPPSYGIPEFTVYKADPEGEFEYTKLLGAKFTIKYYDVAGRDEIGSAEPKAQWTFKTVKKDASGGRYMAGFDWQTDEPVSYTFEGDGAFWEVTENGETKRVLPLGWFTVEETEAPEGFLISDRICYGHIYQRTEGGEAVTEIEGTSEGAGTEKDTLVFVDQPEPQILTEASLQSGNREVKDVVSYKYLQSGEKYVVKGWLVDTASGTKVPGSDSSVPLESSSETSGHVDMLLSTEGYDSMQGHNLTAFEELYQVSSSGGAETETLVAEHKDINDSSQTVNICQNLKIKKKVTGNLGDLSKVFEYTAEFSGLEPGQAYAVKGYDEKVFIADPSGGAAIPLKLMDNKSVTIEQLPRGATYRITESASDHVAEFKVFSEDMDGEGAKIEQAAGSNRENGAKELSTAFETVDLFDGTVVVAWENNRDLATVTAVRSYLGIWACALAIVFACTVGLFIKHTKYKDEQEE